MRIKAVLGGVCGAAFFAIVLAMAQTASTANPNSFATSDMDITPTPTCCGGCGDSFSQEKPE